MKCPLCQTEERITSSKNILKEQKLFRRSEKKPYGIYPSERKVGVLMIKPYQLTPVLIQLMYGTAFSLCTLITMNDLFYRKIKRPVFFPVISGLLFGAAAFIENIWFGSMILEPLFLLGG